MRCGTTTCASASCSGCRAPWRPNLLGVSVLVAGEARRRRDVPDRRSARGRLCDRVRDPAAGDSPAVQARPRPDHARQPAGASSAAVRAAVTARSSRPPSEPPSLPSGPPAWRRRRHSRAGRACARTSSWRRPSAGGSSTAGPRRRCARESARSRDRDHRRRARGDRGGDRAEAGGARGLRDPRACRGHRRHLAGQHLPRADRRHPGAGLPVLVRAQSRLVARVRARPGGQALHRPLRRPLRRAGLRAPAKRGARTALGRERTTCGGSSCPTAS